MEKKREGSERETERSRTNVEKKLGIDEVPLVEDRDGQRRLKSTGRKKKDRDQNEDD